MSKNPTYIVGFKRGDFRLIEVKICPLGKRKFIFENIFDKTHIRVGGYNQLMDENHQFWNSKYNFKNRVRKPKLTGELVKTGRYPQGKVPTSGESVKTGQIITKIPSELQTIYNDNSVTEFSSCLEWLKVIRDKVTIQNQEDLVKAAEELRNHLIHSESPKIPPRLKWLYDKLLGPEYSSDRMIVKKDMIGYLDEILDPNNALAKKAVAKSFMKQFPEKHQRYYVNEKYGIGLKAGKGILTASGEKSIRLDKYTGELQFGVSKNKKTQTKSVDSMLVLARVTYLCFQKYTTDDGGSTDSVEEEVLNTIQTVIKSVENKHNKGYHFIFLLDGEYWFRIDSNKEKNRIVELKTLVEDFDNIIVCTSDELKSELPIS